MQDQLVAGGFRITPSVPTSTCAVFAGPLRMPQGVKVSYAPVSRGTCTSALGVAFGAGEGSAVQCSWRGPPSASILRMQVPVLPPPLAFAGGIARKGLGHDRQGD